MTNLPPWKREPALQITSVYNSYYRKTEIVGIRLGEQPTKYRVKRLNNKVCQYTGPLNEQNRQDVIKFLREMLAQLEAIDNPWRTK